MQKHYFSLSSKSFLFASFLVAILTFGVLKLSSAEPKSSATETNPLVNISELPESFMEKYLEDYSALAESDNKENILIVSSAEPPKNTYGAKSVIAAANNQYFLEFETSEMKDLAFSQLNSDPTLTVSENVIREIHDDGEESGDGYMSWGISAMGLDHAKEILENDYDAADVVVAVADTGLDVELFKSHFGEEKLAGTYDVITSSKTYMVDEFGHGSHTAGTVAEGTPASVKIYPVRLSEGRSLYSSDIIAGLDYISYYEVADVVNMSFGGYQYEEAEYLAMEGARSKNIVLVASAGNESTSNESFPSSFDNTISVSALDSTLTFASDFSNYGKMIDFAAPGVDILSINGVQSGTSMAAPHVSAAAAIAKSFNKDFTLEQTIEFLKTRAVDLGFLGRDNRYGNGLINFSGAKLCTSESALCDEFSIFETAVENGIEIAEPTLTPYNYGSLTNILATEIKIKKSDGSETVRSLGDFGTKIEIRGYNPYASGEQTVEVSLGDLNTSFKVTNPENWESGWGYRTYVSQYEYYATLDSYKEHNLNIKTLYFPDTIDGYAVSANDGGCMFRGGFEETGFYCVNDGNNDSKQYETLIFPSNFKRPSINGVVETGNGAFSNVTYIKSLADEIIVGNMSLANLLNLTTLDATVYFEPYVYTDINGNRIEEYGWGPFYRDPSLESITLSSRVSGIPDSAFEGCASLKSIELPDAVTSIGDRAFASSGIKSIILKEGTKKIGEGAFAQSSLESISLPASLEEIGENAFSKTNFLTSITVAENNPIYDSRFNSNTIVLTAEDKLIVGTKNGNVPATVKSIAKGAFQSLDTLATVEIPEGVETIEDGAFTENHYLTKVVLPRSLTSMTERAFDTSPLSDTPSIPWNEVFWVWDNTYAKDRVVEFDWPYVLMDELTEEPPAIAYFGFEHIPEDERYKAKDKATPENTIITVYYYDEESGKILDESEIISDFSVEYNDGSSEAIIGGYNHLVFTFNTASGYKNLKFNVYYNADYLTVEDYTLPTDISAYPGQYLDEIELPEGFSWMNPEEIVEEGKTEYLVRFTPSDTVNYAPVDDIPLTITLKTASTFAEVFPDANLRACIVYNLNAKNGTSLTEETISLEDDVYPMTELDCTQSEVEPSSPAFPVADARGIEKLINLKSLSLRSGASEEDKLKRINLSKNEALESLVIMDTNLAELDLSNAPNLSDLKILNNSETPLVKTSTYLEWREDESGVGSAVMNISNLDFLKNADFSVEPYGWNEPVSATYDEETGLITLGSGGPTELIITVTDPNGGPDTVYRLDGAVRKLFFTAFIDNEEIAKNLDLSYAYTNSKIDPKESAEYLLIILGYDPSKYIVEDIHIASDDDMFVVGESDVYFTVRYKTKSTTPPTDPTDPTTPEVPDDPIFPIMPTDDDSAPASPDVKIPNTGSYAAKPESLSSIDRSQTLLGIILTAVSLILIFVVSHIIKKKYHR